MALRQVFAALKGPVSAIIFNGWSAAMVGSVNGILGLCKADQSFPEFWNSTASSTGKATDYVPCGPI